MLSCSRDLITNTHNPPNTLNLHHEPPLHTALPQPGEHKPPVPTQTDLYNIPKTALINTYMTQHTATTQHTHTHFILSHSLRTRNRSSSLGRYKDLCGLFERASSS